MYCSDCPSCLLYTSHNGHAYQLAKARELTGADYLVVIMSGDFVQRGAPAILDQHDRAELALLGGADLVLQLPCHFALGSAQHFARGAVSLLTALGCVDFLCFGSEYGDTAPFLELADVLLHEPEKYRELLSGLLRNGLSFPTARAQALSAYLSLIHISWEPVPEISIRLLLSICATKRT